MSITRQSKAARPWWVGIVSGMASYIDAAAITGFGAAIVIFGNTLGLTPLEIGVASGVLTAAIAVGALVGGRLGDRLGRRPVFTATMILIILASAGLIFTGSFPVILTAAAVLGLATGADLPVSLSTIAEAATDHNRGRLIGFSNLLWLAGAVVNTVLIGVFADRGALGVTVIFGHLALVSLLVLLGRLTIPESESWAAAKRERASGVRTVRADRARVRDLLRAPYATPFFALVVFYGLTNVAANTTGQFQAYILITFGDGITFEQASLVVAASLPFAVGGYLWFMRIADKPVRFVYFVVGGVLMLVASALPAIFGITIPTVTVAGIIGMLGGAFAFEGMMKVWSQEQFPTLLRTTAQGAIIAVGRLTAAVFAAFTPTLLQAGTALFYGLLTALSAVGLVVAFLVFRGRDGRNEFDTEQARDIPTTPARSI